VAVQYGRVGPSRAERLLTRDYVVDVPEPRTAQREPTKANTQTRRTPNPLPCFLLYEDCGLSKYPCFLGVIHERRAKRRSKGQEKRRKRISTVLR